jgi:hypothetical protein
MTCTISCLWHGTSPRVGNGHCSGRVVGYRSVGLVADPKINRGRHARHDFAAVVWYVSSRCEWVVGYRSVSLVVDPKINRGPHAYTISLLLYGTSPRVGNSYCSGRVVGYRPVSLVFDPCVDALSDDHYHS